MKIKKHRLVGMGICWIGVTALNVALLPAKYAPHVDVTTVKVEPLVLMVRAGGELAPKRSVILKAEFEGPVVSKLFKEGQAVRKGDILAEIGRDKIRLDYENKVTAVKNAESDLAKARKDQRVQRQLYRHQAVALSSVEDAERATVRAEQALRTARETLRLEEQLWNKNKIQVPFDGTLVKDSLGEDTSVSAGKELATLADISEFSVTARVDELEIGQVHVGQPAEVRLDAYPGRSFHAKVADISTEAEGSAVPVIPVTLQLEKVQQLPLLPKLSATVYITTGRTEPVLSIPLAALSNQSGETRVWVLDGLNRLRARPVSIGRSNPDRAEVTRGLSAGERIAATNSTGLMQGRKVIVEKEHG
jgi:RND family efflux transporter MFP subunit